LPLYFLLQLLMLWEAKKARLLPALGAGHLLALVGNVGHQLGKPIQGLTAVCQCFAQT
jgi:uncharacterized membrane protein